MNKKEKKFEEKEVARVRELLYQIAQMDYQNFKNQNKNLINVKERNHLHKGLN